MGSECKPLDTDNRPVFSKIWEGGGRVAKGQMERNLGTVGEGYGILLAGVVL